MLFRSNLDVNPRSGYGATHADGAQVSTGTTGLALAPADGWKCVRLVTSLTNTAVRFEVPYLPEFVYFNQASAGDQFLLAMMAILPGAHKLGKDAGIIPNFNLFT